MSNEPVKTILIVDDDEDIVRMLTVLFESRNFHVRTGFSGAQGAVEFELGEVDLVITDLNMPAGNGVALINRIRRSSGELPIIVVTAFSKEYSEPLRSVKKLTVLQKPIDSEALLDLIDVELCMDPPDRAAA